MSELVSLIIPVYNVGRGYLDDCLESVLQQTYQNIEVICVDDGSTDGCFELLDVWAHRDTRLRVIHKENGGVSSARNIGLKIARGDYIGFVDADDRVDITYIENMVSAINETDSCCQWACCGLRSESMKPEICSNLVFSGDELYTHVIEDPVFARGVYAKLFKSTLRLELFDESLSIGEDYVWLARLALRAPCCVYTGSREYVYRNRETSAIHEKNRSPLGKATFVDVRSHEIVCRLFADTPGLVIAQKSHLNLIRRVLSSAYEDVSYRGSEEFALLLNKGVSLCKDYHPDSLRGRIAKGKNMLVFWLMLHSASPCIINYLERIKEKRFS